MRKTVIVSLALLLAACSNSSMNVSKSEGLGAGLGAIAGGVIGYQFGGGIGNALYTTAGALLGGTGGYYLGQRLGPSDQAQYDKTASQALSSAADGSTIAWSNPETGTKGIFRPVRSYRPGNDYLCREYRAVVSLDKEVLRGSGTACQLSDGQWRNFEDQTAG